ncbi:hypothetical protein ASPACDRAFT_75454 [Aspergillus aculeatus ATCC 16872]|uniref:Nascent polypeptide-associated complex subunit alpha-like UBA domain-containing protein n=1 Tax=Aspergillus aculeatus (strain ATCC 16872 / CBS 172.66 / WB 5094) TaxID=690307 RepID=A0A1L9X638_ASPA1|nr:uncharacterized protein ASPACDRAFT_75454 [Aspergillus aculeatus ATCC 16872]OJK03936.1 hypothetical protein ASPACDRAFT_75454 [Aspergillus aculeatus ATCC 16872]
MSDSIPSAHADPDAAEQPLPANAEDRKAAAALSSLHTNEIAATDSPTRLPSSADQEALGKAMSRLEIAAGHPAGKKRAGTTQQSKEGGELVKKKAVKVSTDDVNLLVDQLDLNKLRATELLKAHEGNVAQAIKAFITPATLAR